MLTDIVDVLIVDDHPVVCDGVAAQLRGHEDIRVVGVACSGEQAVVETTRLSPDVVVLDVRLPDRPAPDIISLIRATSPDTRVLLFTAFPEHISVGPTLAAGAAGLVVKDASVAALAAAIRDVARTGRYRPAGGDGGDPAQRCSGLVSAREYDIIRLVATGLTNSEIAAQLYLSPNTVKAYLATAMRKLAARNRAQVITRARTLGIL
ncbi:response regulator transcription factor [Pseudonocardia sp. WMMC193]|uniref:response regulator transcription factor n=1 Tax=Pseudonocardia sp. WMMC193 TaxID=2911965 RepID=UPI001F31EDDF|nr:response regulator transcription factor [Pseudonocardia sp. WMMC193]MCF7549318.1 response regulator transcription factor [Pseudonocardia sp. WMMC193]